MSKLTDILKFEFCVDEIKTAIGKFKNPSSGTGANQYVDVITRYLLLGLEVEGIIRVVQQDLSQGDYAKAAAKSAIILGSFEVLKFGAHRFFKLFEPIDARLGNYIHETRKRYYRGIN